MMECLKNMLNSKRSTGSMTPAKTRQRTHPTRVLQPAHTIRLRPEQLAQAESVLLRLRSSGSTDTGLVREHNEDWYSLASFGNQSLFVVADGMGGHDSGEVASRLAVDTVCRIVRKEHANVPDPLALVEHAVHRANAEVRGQATRKGSDMGTTLSIALVSDDTAYVANVGDSRVYWMLNGSISRITTDHSLVAKLVEAGRLTDEEARNHPQANLLYRTIGLDEEVAVDTFRVPLAKGGTLLLCTDGLWGELTDEELRSICAAEQNARNAADRLVRTAKERGGRDNITAIVAHIA